LKNWLVVFLGGSTGATLRFFVQSLSNTSIMLWFVNILGSFLLGCLNGIFIKRNHESLKLFLTTGMLGAFTTFSTFSQSWFMLIKENFVLGIIYGISMTICCYISAFIGYRLLKGERLWNGS